MDSGQFIGIIRESAIQAQRQYGICASLTIAQAILESAWGKSAPGNNLFGIKWSEGCGYEKQILPTKEFINGAWININASFRCYNSFEDSIKDYIQFLLKNSCYKKLIGIMDYKLACREIQEAGYATDPNYANSLIQIIEENKLYVYDMEANMVEAIAVYGNDIDKRAAEYLSDFLRCPIIHKDNTDNIIQYVNTVYVVGGSWKPNDKAILIAGTDRYETMIAVLRFMKKI